MATDYGLDTWCGAGLFTGRRVRGPMVVALALYHRLITPRGTLRGVNEEEDEANYGFDLASYCGKVGYPVTIQAFPGLIRGELLKDDRVRDVDVSVTSSLDAAGRITLTVEVDVVLHDEQDSFALTLSVNDVTTTLLGVVT